MWAHRDPAETPRFPGGLRTAQLSHGARAGLARRPCGVSWTLRMPAGTGARCARNMTKFAMGRDKVAQGSRGNPTRLERGSGETSAGLPLGSRKTPCAASAPRAGGPRGLPTPRNAVGPRDRPHDETAGATHAICAHTAICILPELHERTSRGALWRVKLDGF